jgi:hypothetical protein
MEDGFALLVLIAVVAGVFWLGFRLGYRYRDNLSLERQKKYRTSKGKIAVADVGSVAAAENENRARS